MTLGLLEIVRSLPLAVWLPMMLGFLVPLLGAVARGPLSHGGRATLAAQFAMRSGVLVGVALAVLGALATIAAARLGLEGLLPTAQALAERDVQGVQREWQRTGGEPRVMLAKLTDNRGTDGRIVAMTVAAYPCESRCTPIGPVWKPIAGLRAIHDRFDDAPAGRTTGVALLDGHTVVLSRAPLRDASGALTGLMVVVLDAQSVLARTVRLAWQVVLASLLIVAIAIAATATAVRRSYAAKIRALIDRIDRPAAVDENDDTRDELLQLSGKIEHLVQRAVDLDAALHEKRRLEGIGRLAGGIAHEFNNQMFTVLASAELASGSLPASAPEREDLRLITNAAARAAALTAKLMQYSGLQLEPRIPLDLRSLLVSVLATVPQGGSPPIRVVTALPDDALGVTGDARHLEQLIRELTDNAGAAMPDGGVLNIALASTTLTESVSAAGLSAAPGRYAELIVTDTGVGMAADVVSRIFEPFYTTRPFRPAAGLGLAAVHGIVKMHGGVIRVRSEQGRGTTVSLLLPLIVTMADTTGSGARTTATLEAG